MKMTQQLPRLPLDLVEDILLIAAKRGNPYLAPRARQCSCIGGLSQQLPYELATRVADFSSKRRCPPRPGFDVLAAEFREYLYVAGGLPRLTVHVCRYFRGMALFHILAEDRPDRLAVYARCRRAFLSDLHSVASRFIIPPLVEHGRHAVLAHLLRHPVCELPVAEILSEAKQRGRTEVLDLWLRAAFPALCFDEASEAVADLAKLQAAAKDRSSSRAAVERAVLIRLIVSLDLSSARGHLAMVKWLVRHFPASVRYTDLALDEASANGHVDVVRWWLCESGLPLKYTARAVDAASANGHVAVVDVWVRSGRPIKHAGSMTTTTRRLADGSAHIAVARV
ncbi:hypothetical protein H9P43_001888 [Blastocladiella emersonii ATCC 22665]|nr:hypothetical protein H9P43_001888 [Blastocladiella emersonii ATCC 22665]